MAISWLLKDARVTSVLVGVSSQEQLQNNLTAITKLKFTNDELGEIESILSVE
jgi:L-glyceraldehyde 3-phosphate reductase